MYSDKILSKNKRVFLIFPTVSFLSTALRIVPQNLDLSALRTQLRALFILHLAQRPPVVRATTHPLAGSVP
jgi:hypothetical protein